MPRTLPPLNAVRVFDSAAKHLSFTRAAEELSVTQGAVSRQIRRLEEDLRQTLFERHGPRLTLTAAGERFQQVARESLGILRRGARELRDARSRPVLTVSLLPSFTSRWLISRLSDFEQRYPGIAIRLASSYDVIDFAREPDVDCAIRFGAGNWSGVEATRLTREHVFPVCAPSLLNSLHAPEDLDKARLLSGDASDDEWSEWIEATGVSIAYDREFTHQFNDFSVLYQAAVAGQGIALGRTLLVQDDLDAGRLVRPFGMEVASQFQYYFVCPPGRINEPEVKAFRDWLLEAAAPTD